MNTMFETMLQLPLFQGLAHDDFTKILAKVKLGFTKHKVGEEIAYAGGTCDQLIFVLKGEVSVCTAFLGIPSCSLTEFIHAPFVVEPQSLFGMKTSYVSTYIAQTEVHTLSVNKSFIMNELLCYDIFRLNYTNIICNRSQNLRNRLWSLHKGNAELHIAHFILAHSERPVGKKILKIKMEELAQAINSTRLSVSKALNDMQDQGLLTLHRGEIIVWEVEKLR